MCGCSLVLRYPEHPSHSFTDSEKKTEMLVYLYSHQDFQIEGCNM